MPLANRPYWTHTGWSSPSLFRGLPPAPYGSGEPPPSGAVPLPVTACSDRARALGALGVDQCDLLQRREPGELVERVVQHVLRDGLYVVEEEVGDPRDHFLHQLHVQVGPALRLLVSRQGL